MGERAASEEAEASDERPAAAGVGASEAPDPYAAGARAAQRACAVLPDGRAAFVVVTASVRYDLDRLLAGVRAVTGDAPVVGATGDGHFLAGTYVRRGTGVAVCALPEGAHRFGTAVAGGLRRDPSGTGEAVARAAREAVPGGPGPRDAVLLFSDGLQPRQQGLLHGVHRVAGARVPVAGGAAGDDRRGHRTFVFHQGEVLEDAAVAAWIASDTVPRVTTAHAWSPAGAPMLVTHAAGPVIHELDGRPAAVVYAEQLEADPEVRAAAPDDPLSLRLLRPLGLLQPDGSHLVRSVRTHRDVGELPAHALLAFSDIPSNAAVQLMRGSGESLLESTKRLVAEALDGVVEPSCVLVCSCTLHEDLCGDRIHDQVRWLQDVAGDVPTFGLHTYGEFARTVGGAGYHNASLSALVL